MLRAVHLTKQFGNLTAVDDVSFEVGKGEIFAFLGPNGAGKTTTIRMLTTMLRPTSGSLEIDGVDPEMDPEEARRKFGIVFQDPSLDGDLTAWENMELHGVFYGLDRRLRNLRGEELLRKFNLWERRSDPVKQFSGGMKRRLEIARSLLHTPPVLFLDEPTLGLDPQTRHQLWSQIQQLRGDEGTTVFLTTHYLDEADQVADRVAIIDHGTVKALGSPLELKAMTGTETLEKAFLSLTGSGIREEGADTGETMRVISRMWSKR